VTEIPEHLLRRSRERRAAAGGGGGDEGGGGGSEAAATPAPAAATPARAAAPAAKAAPAPAAPPKPKTVKPAVLAAQRRTKIPVWALPVLALLPLWAFLYAESLRNPEVKLSGPVAEGEEIFLRACSGCHGAQGQGGAGRQLNGGNVLLTFPGADGFTQQVHFVTNGSAEVLGKVYGDPNRPGGPHTGGSFTGTPMPAQGVNATGASKGSLSDAQVVAVVCYERVVIGGEAAPEECQGGAAAGGHE
jgi:hypothetical protein